MLIKKIENTDYIEFTKVITQVILGIVSSHSIIVKN